MVERRFIGIAVFVGILKLLWRNFRIVQLTIFEASVVEGASYTNSTNGIKSVGILHYCALN